MFFILGNDGSASLTLANVLLEQGDCLCLHDPDPALREAAIACRHGEITTARLGGALPGFRRSRLNGKDYGEAGPALGLMIAPLGAAFPEARFVWLIRSALEEVSEAVAGGWYSASDRRTRLCGDQCGDVTAETWARMEPFERCCWHWSYVNRTIGRDLESHVPPARFRLVRHEEMDEWIDELCQWLGFGRVRPRPVAPREPHGTTAQPWLEWDSASWAAFERWCAPLMDHHYPQWRALRPGSDAVAVEPPDLTQLRGAGEARFAAGDLEAARALFEQALARHPDDPGVLNDLAVCLWAAGEPGPALLHAARGLEIAPDDRNLILNGGAILEGCGRSDDAAALYESYLAEQPGDAELRARLEDLRSAAAGASETGGPVGPDAPGTAVPASADEWAREGEARFADRDLDGAEQAFLQALTCDPRHVAALNDLGVVCREKGDLPRALDCLRRALEVRPTDRDTVLNLGCMLVEMRQDEVAQLLYESYLRHCPDDDAVRHSLERLGVAPCVAAR